MVMSADWAVEVEGLGKRYDLGEREQYLALRDVLARLPRRLVEASRSRNHRTARDQAWVLRDLDFRIAPGEVVGIVGRNGAGKSTLLKIVSNIVRPTTGRASMRGRVGSLLEVGSGFHPELTGAENIWLNGAILGMRRAEIAQRFDDIVDFAGMGRFLDTPVKRYSTGMYMRLAFSVAAHLEPDILVVDEVLAVGDADFQRKCLGRMRTLAGDQGRTVLFVSHDLDAVSQLCPRSIWLDRGRVRADAPTHRVVQEYLGEQIGHTVVGRWIDMHPTTARPPRVGSGEVMVHRLRYAGVPTDPVRRSGRTPVVGGPVCIQFEVEAVEQVRLASVVVQVATAAGTTLIDADSLADSAPLDLAPGRHRLEIFLDALHLTAGSYRMSVRIARDRSRRKFSVYDHVDVPADLVVADGDGSSPAGALVPCRAVVREVAL